MELEPKHEGNKSKHQKFAPPRRDAKPSQSCYSKRGADVVVKRDIAIISGCKYILKKATPHWIPEADCILHNVDQYDRCLHKQDRINRPHGSGSGKPERNKDGVEDEDA